VATAFWISYAALWFLFVAAAIAMLALYNHFGQMYMVSREGRSSHGPAEGAPLKATNAEDLHGLAVRLPELGRSQVILFATTDCGLCAEIKPGLNNFARAHVDVDVSLICGGAAEAVERWSRDINQPVRVVPDRGRKIATGYGISISPFLLITNEDGIVLTRGIVNGEEGLEMALAVAGGVDLDELSALEVQHDSHA